jgi:hypothetical protein
MAIVRMASADFSSMKNVAVFDALQQCIQVAVENGQLCLRLPAGVGDVCVDIPEIIPNGTLAEACVSLGFPACVKLTVRALGQKVVDEEFGSCS